MQEVLNQSARRKPESSLEDVFIILCATGFENVARARSALMFASLAASAKYRTILYCIQDAVDLMVRGALDQRQETEQGVPTVFRRLEEAIAAGVEIQCCTQTMANKRIIAENLLPGVKPAGAMNLIALTSTAKGALCF
jgi:predicted peroxiredoxin